MRTHVVTAFAFSAALTAFCVTSPAPALAQNLYKHVDANGKVTYTDVPLNKEEKSLAIANTARNGDGDGARTKKDNRKKVAAEGNQQAKGKGGKREQQKKSQKTPDSDSPK